MYDLKWTVTEYVPYEQSNEWHFETDEEVMKHLERQQAFKLGRYSDFYIRPCSDDMTAHEFKEKFEKGLL